ncbi:MAG: hypothetical protein H7258_07515, partial [Ferruginibacter sp.]|nr:hypothetical protein [Ferruginibacter sp.]
MIKATIFNFSNRNKKYITFLIAFLFLFISCFAQHADNMISSGDSSFGLWIFAILLILPLLIIIGKLYFDFKLQVRANGSWKREGTVLKFSQYLKNFDRKQIRAFLKMKNKNTGGDDE